MALGSCMMRGSRQGSRQDEPPIRNKRRSWNSKDTRIIDTLHRRINDGQV